MIHEKIKAEIEYHLDKVGIKRNDFDMQIIITKDGREIIAPMIKDETHVVIYKPMEMIKEYKNSLRYSYALFPLYPHSSDIFYSLLFERDIKDILNPKDEYVKMYNRYNLKEEKYDPEDIPEDFMNQIYTTILENFNDYTISH